MDKLLVQDSAVKYRSEERVARAKTRPNSVAVVSRLLRENPAGRRNERLLEVDAVKGLAVLDPSRAVVLKPVARFLLPSAHENHVFVCA